MSKGLTRTGHCFIKTVGYSMPIDPGVPLARSLCGAAAFEASVPFPLR